MTMINRFTLTVGVMLCATLLINAQGQTARLSTVNVTSDNERVRVAAQGDVSEMRMEVSDEAGEVVFESGAVTGNRLDWKMRDAQGERVRPGTYLVTVTYRTQAGKLRQRVEQVLVTEEVTNGTNGANSTQESPTPQAIGSTITGQGTAGKIAKFTSADQIGDSLIMESAGKIGIGTTTPATKLHLLSGNGEALRFQTTGNSQTANSIIGVSPFGDATGGALYLGPNFFLTGSGIVSRYDTSSIGWGFGFDNRPAVDAYRIIRVAPNGVITIPFVVEGSGNVGIGTSAPASKLAVSGNVEIIGAGNGIKFADGSIQTKATSGTINGTGATNQIAKFTGPNSFGNSAISEVSGNVGIGTTTPKRPLEIASGKLRMSSDLGDIEFTEVADLIAHATTANPAGNLPAFRVDVGTGLKRAFTVLNNGNVGIGAPDPLRALQIGPSFDAAFTISPSDTSPRAGFIRFGDNTGWTLHFARSRESSGGPLNTGITGNLMELRDDGRLRLVGFPEGATGTGPLCRTLSNVVTICQSGSSSLRYKTNVAPYLSGLDIVRRLQPIRFNRKETGKRDIGLAAEEVEKAEPLLTFPNEKGEVEGVRYELLNVVLINAVKEQQKQIEQLRAQVAQLRRAVRQKRATGRRGRK